MVWEIVKKELLDGIKSLRFILTFVLVVFLLIVGGFVFINKYEQEIKDYRQEINKNLAALAQKAKNLSSVAFDDQTIYKTPKLFELCAEGFEKSLPNSFEVDVFTIKYPEFTSRGNFLLPRFNDIDWVFIISVIFSLVAILLAHDSVSGEKERGTLSLILSNSIPREKVLLGKYLGLMLTLMIPFCIGLLMNLIIVNTSPLISLGVTEWLKILVIILISIVFLSIFILLGILISSRTKKSSTTLVVLLFLWVILVIIIPACGRIVATKFYGIPIRPEVEQRIRETQRQIWDEGRRPPSKAGRWLGDPFAEYVPQRAKLVNKMTAARNRIFDHYIKQMIEQINNARNITRISLAAVYQYGGEAIAATGIPRFAAFYAQIKRYKEVLRSFVLERDKEDSDSAHLLFDDKRICISQKPVDFEAIPKFQERDILLAQSLHNAIWDLALLILFNVVFFAGAYVSFLRYDVR